ncbi:MAG: pre-peptidase C-terminal domain-containing protein [Myxococcales bacterium]|nr:pre-peptidase C-terminal domain-containing protein [Myxococcales bacterium]
MCFALLSGVSVVGCGSEDGQDNRRPSLSSVADQTVGVNQPLSFSVLGSDPDGDSLNFDFSSDSPGVTSRASLTPAGSDAAIFNWTPTATDVGIHVVDFSVSDGQTSDTRAVTIEVRSSVGNGAPVFRKPLGTGTTLDLAQKKCVEVAIEVEDPDSPGVTISQTEPLIQGAELIQDTGLTATWTFCPTPAQIQAEDIYTLRLAADDGDNPAVTKNFVVVLRKAQKSGCPGGAPVVEHTPMDVSGINDIEIHAHVTDDLGIKYEPLLLYAASDPGTPPDLGAMTQVSMTRQSGNQKDGEWLGRIPNPVAASGGTAELHYILVARDDDDAAADCDHLTQVPATGSFQIEVTAAGGGGGLGLCEPCSADAQCGGTTDLCVQVGGDASCLSACGVGGTCPQGYTCSASALTSESGASARQCVPSSQTCAGDPPPACMDDTYEQNDSLSAAKTLPPGDELLVSCPAGDTDDEDWFRLEVTEEGQLSLDLLGDSSSDLDLALYDTGGALVARSSNLDSEESIQSCVSAGTYYARVYSYDLARNEYILDWSVAAQSCGPSCSDDAAEDDDQASQARAVDLDSGPYVTTTNAICSWDEDWFRVDLFAGETLYAELTFAQASAMEDLDVLLYQGPTLLTQCDEFDVSGCSDNGQSNDSNESFSYPISVSDTYYLVVRGYGGAENLYDLCIGLSPSECP